MIRLRATVKRLEVSASLLPRRQYVSEVLVAETLCVRKRLILYFRTSPHRNNLQMELLPAFLIQITAHGVKVMD